MRPSTRLIVLGVLVIGAAIIILIQLFPSSTLSFQSTVIQVDTSRLVVEVADTGQKQERGLMFRESLPQDYGMIFVFDRVGRYTFWMRDVRIPLDIIWFDDNRRAVFIATNLQPCTTLLCPLYTPDTDAKYALEVNAGFVGRHGISLNSTLTFAGSAFT